jgi:hypothetical protein
MPVKITCHGCGCGFEVPKCRTQTARFHSVDCYHENTDRRRNYAGVRPIIGAELNWITTLEIDGNRIKGQCRCGMIKWFRKEAIISGRVKSCGCYNRIKSRLEGEAGAWRHWFNYLKTAAKSHNRDFVLSLEKVKVICTQECSYCGALPQKWMGARNQYLASCRVGKTRSPDIDFANSKILFLNGIDRIDSKLGYTASNVVPCCRICNTAKQDMSVGEFKTWVGRCFNHLVNDSS